MSDPATVRFEEQSRALFHDSVESVDMRVRSRLTQARHAALAAAARPRRLAELRWWAPAAGFSAAAVLGAALWFGPHALHRPFDRPLPAEAASTANLEDLDLVASSDDLELLQEDAEFYDWASKTAAPEPGSVG
jgi:hypothetical protein